MLKKISAIIMLLISIAIIWIGADEMNTYTVCKEYKAKDHPVTYDVKSASFGADFYSYMYKASDTMVSELNDALALEDEINKNVVQAGNQVASQVSYLSQDVRETGGLIILCFGLALFGFSLINLSNAFEIKKKSTQINETIEESRVEVVTKEPIADIEAMTEASTETSAE